MPFREPPLNSQPSRQQFMIASNFLEGIRRTVHEEDDGQQGVEGYDCERVHGIWMLPADEPAIGDGNTVDYDVQGAS
jgi:hypothetical protein